MSYHKINMLHILLIGPVISYIGFRDKKTDKIAYGVLLGLALCIPFIVRTPGFKANYRNGINWIHYLVWPTLFLYVVYKQSELQPYWFEIMKYFGIFVSVLHAYFIYKNYSSSLINN
jgi:hypothetical protein